MIDVCYKQIIILIFVVGQRCLVGLPLEMTLARSGEPLSQPHLSSAKKKWTNCRIVLQRTVLPNVRYCSVDLCALW